MSDRSFAHLHLHTEYSRLDGAARIPDVVAAAAADSQPAVGLTDHGVLYGAVDFYQQATAAGLTPVIGMEGYLTPGSRFDRPPRRDDVRYHITLLAVTQEGYGGRPRRSCGARPRTCSRTARTASARSPTAPARSTTP